MNDRELLELAAKAAGHQFEESIYPGWLWIDGRNWNALADDGDALRLAVRLKLDVFTGQGMRGDITTVCAPPEHDIESCGERHGTDAASATRRAIVTIAAEIGKGN